MLRFEEVLRVETVRRVERGAGTPLRGALRACASAMMLAVFIAGNALIAPAVAAAATQDAKPEKTVGPAAGGHKVSPHLIASRQRREAAIAAGEHGAKRPVWQPSQTKTVRPKRH